VDLLLCAVGLKLGLSSLPYTKKGTNFAAKKKGEKRIEPKVTNFKEPIWTATVPVGFQVKPPNIFTDIYDKLYAVFGKPKKSDI
jgi:hypothetical protein